MAIYHHQIKKIKKENAQIIKTKFLRKSVRLFPVDNSEESSKLCLKWRMKYWDGFDTKFKGTQNLTKKWIEKITKDPNRILFFITFGGEKIGHIGLDSYDENDNSVYITDVLRGVRSNSPGLMEFVQKLFIKWIFNDLQIKKIKIKAFSDNFKAIHLYEKCGFLTVNSIPLKRRFTKDGWKWSKTKVKNDDQYAERYFSIMEISK